MSIPRFRHITVKKEFMSVKRFIFTLFPLIILSSYLFSQHIEPELDPQRSALLCKAFFRGDLKALQPHSSPEMKEAIGNGTLALGVLQISTMFGKLRSLEGVPAKVTTMNGITVFTQKARLERQTLTCFLSIDSNGKLCGFHVRPQQEEKKESPASLLRERSVKIGGASALPGTLTLPRGKGPYPAVLLIHGSGANDRDETIQGNKPFRDLAELLAERNIAVLRYDKRTFVYPEEFKKRQSVTIDDEAVHDVLEAIHLLKNTPEIDQNAIWLLGHSLGGMILPRIASKTSIPAGYLFLAAPATPLPDVLEEQGIHLLRQNTTLPETEKKKALAALRKQTQILKHPTRETIPGPLFAYWKDLSTYNPLSMAQKISRPMLFLQGKRDFQVQPHHLDLWKNALNGKPNCQFLLYDDLNHLMLPGKGAPGMAEYAVPSKIPAKVADDIAAFLRKSAANGTSGSDPFFTRHSETGKTEASPASEPPAPGRHSLRPPDGNSYFRRSPVRRFHASFGRRNSSTTPLLLNPRGRDSTP